MCMYPYSEALQKFAYLLEEAVEKGEVRIRRDDGQVLVIRPESPAASFPKNQKEKETRWLMYRIKTSLCKSSN